MENNSVKLNKVNKIVKHQYRLSGQSNNFNTISSAKCLNQRKIIRHCSLFRENRFNNNCWRMCRQFIVNKTTFQGHTEIQPMRIRKVSVVAPRKKCPIQVVLRFWPKWSDKIGNHDVIYHTQTLIKWENKQRAKRILKKNCVKNSARVLLFTLRSIQLYFMWFSFFRWI